jgi:hypothetical protein
MATLHPTDGPIHDWFGLSYCNYQVLPRTLMQSMPIDWQQRMVACLAELRDAFRHIEQAEAYDVKAGEQHLVGELTDTQMRRLGITCMEFDEDPPPLESFADDEAVSDWETTHRLPEPVYFDAAGDELSAHEYVVVPAGDPVPHYNRGRTYIEPRIGETAA